MSEQTTSKPWYKKWWVITLFIFLGLIIIGSLADNDSSTNQINPSAQKNQEDQAKAKNEPITQESENKESVQINEEVKKLDYQIVYELSNIRYDGGKNFYVLVDKIDLSNADFKNDIKKMVDEIVKIKGGKISIDFVNNKEVLELIYKSNYGNNTLGRILTKAEMDKIGNSNVAQFSGQLETDIYLNSLSFFPGTFTDNPNVGKYVETIEYNPSK
jgi:hypothetical protein